MCLGVIFREWSWMIPIDSSLFGGSTLNKTDLQIFIRLFFMNILIYITLYHGILYNIYIYKPASSGSENSRQYVLYLKSQSPDGVPLVKLWRSCHWAPDSKRWLVQTQVVVLIQRWWVRSKPTTMFQIFVWCEMVTCESYEDPSSTGW